MSDTKQIAYDKHSFIIRGKREFLIGGEFHYFRTPNELWEDRLIKMKRTGANLVTTYIPWNWHEPVEGKQRWDGDADLREVRRALHEARPVRRREARPVLLRRVGFRRAPGLAAQQGHSPARAERQVSRVRPRLVQEGRRSHQPVPRHQGRQHHLHPGRERVRPPDGVRRGEDFQGRRDQVLHAPRQHDGGVRDRYSEVRQRGRVPARQGQHHRHPHVLPEHPAVPVLDVHAQLLRRQDRGGEAGPAQLPDDDPRAAGRLVRPVRPPAVHRAGPPDRERFEERRRARRVDAELLHVRRRHDVPVLGLPRQHLGHSPARHRHGHDVRFRRLAGPRVGRADAGPRRFHRGARAVHARLQGARARVRELQRPEGHRRRREHFVRPAGQRRARHLAHERDGKLQA